MFPKSAVNNDEVWGLPRIPRTDRLANQNKIIMINKEAQQDDIKASAFPKRKNRYRVEGSEWKRVGQEA